MGLINLFVSLEVIDIYDTKIDQKSEEGFLKLTLFFIKMETVYPGEIVGFIKIGHSTCRLSYKLLGRSFSSQSTLEGR